MVNNKTIDAKILSRMFLSGAKNLEAKKEWINELNVFPVPDGDTGTNMTLTIMSAASEVGALTDPDMESLAKAISSGSLRGARGNSGVILSQLLRGFTRGVRKLTDLDAPAIAAAMERGVETAYKAVMKPKEGTILTVARAAADRAAELADAAEDLDAFFDGIFQHAEETLARTPEMLPVLKEAGVVDSGGQGLLEVFRGAIDGYHGKEVDYSQFETAAAPKITKISPQAEADIKFGYCTEFIILLEKPLPQEEIDRFREFLDSIGDSIVLVADDEIVKVHVHTNHPGQAFERALTYGQLSRMKIDNMREEHQEKLIKDAEKLAKEQAENKVLASTGNSVIDGALLNMYIKASAHEINFDLIANTDINYLINHFLSQTELETLLCDHIKDAVIAVESTGKRNGNILTSVSSVDGIYEISVSDNGIEFETDTLQKLGTERVTTHKESGGNGIGFMTTFDTLKNSKASLIITEYEPDKPFTKTVTFRFDGQGNFIIKSYRCEILKEKIIREDILITYN